MTTYIGFSTKQSNKNFDLYDAEIVKQDLLNHFYTKKGERILRPTFGCDIHKYLFEQSTDITKSHILLAAKEVFDADPRVQVLEMDLLQQHNKLIVSALIKIHYVDDIQQFIAEFETSEVF